MKRFLLFVVLLLFPLIAIAAEEKEAALNKIIYEKIMRFSDTELRYYGGMLKTYEGKTYSQIDLEKLKVSCIDWTHSTPKNIVAPWSFSVYNVPSVKPLFKGREFNYALNECQREADHQGLDCQCQPLDFNGTNELKIPASFVERMENKKANPIDTIIIAGLPVTSGSYDYERFPKRWKSLSPKIPAIIKVKLKYKFAEKEIHSFMSDVKEGTRIFGGHNSCEGDTVACPYNEKSIRGLWRRHRQDVRKLSRDNGCPESENFGGIARLYERSAGVGIAALIAIETGYCGKDVKYLGVQPKLAAELKDGGKLWDSVRTPPQRP